MSEIIPNHADICKLLVDSQRLRSTVIKTRNMILNRIASVLASMTGYSVDDTEAERKKSYEAACKLRNDILAACKKGVAHEHPLAWIVVDVQQSIEAQNDRQKKIERQMLELVDQLPIASWIEEPEQHGIGLLQVATVIGECGDLSGYANPAKVWRRLGCAPWTHGEHTLMGATWRAGKVAKLPNDQWCLYGYNPRRRSLAYLIGECIVKQNINRATKEPYPYRAIYLRRKAEAAQKHPDWTPMHCSRHAMLLATKAFLMDLWRVWHGKEARHGRRITPEERAAELAELAA